MVNAYTLSDGVARIELSQGLVGLVDEIDLPKLEPDGVEFARIGRWCANLVGRTFYMVARARLPDGSVAQARAHRLIMGLKRGDQLEGDHIHHNGLDNRRSELRVTDTAGNQLNYRGKRPRRRGQTPTSQYPGVYKYECKSGPKWSAQIALAYHIIRLGSFDVEKDAADAYIRAKAVRDAGGGREEIEATVDRRRYPGRSARGQFQRN
jgi:hypothetical protein